MHWRRIIPSFTPIVNSVGGGEGRQGRFTSNGLYFLSEVVLCYLPHRSRGHRHGLILGIVTEYTKLKKSTRLLMLCPYGPFYHQHRPPRHPEKYTKNILLSRLIE